MNYFQNFRQVSYDVLGDGISSLMTDFTPGFKVRNANLIKNTSYMNHVIGDGERPDVTSHMLYGTTSYHWTFFVINDRLRKGISEWPMGQNELDRYVSLKYDRYAVITFDPTDSNTNLSYVPFTEEFINSLYLAVDTVDGIAYRKIISYDTLSCQMVIERQSPTLNIKDTDIDFQAEYNPIDIDILSFIGFESYRIISFVFKTIENVDYINGPNQNFIDTVNASYQLDIGEDSSQYYYNVALDVDGNDLNYSLMKNAPYQFYETVNDELISISAYDVIAGNNEFSNVNRITYSEMEETINNQKRTISVINPANIARFSQSYFDVLRNG